MTLQSTPTGHGPAGLHRQPIMRKIAWIIALIVAIGYVSNVVSGQAMVRRMGTEYMGAAYGNNPTHKKKFDDSAHVQYYIPYYVKVFVYIKQDTWLYTDGQSALCLFGWNLHVFHDKMRLTT